VQVPVNRYSPSLESGIRHDVFQAFHDRIPPVIFSPFNNVEVVVKSSASSGSQHASKALAWASTVTASRRIGRDILYRLPEFEDIRAHCF